MATEIYKVNYKDLTSVRDDLIEYGLVLIENADIMLSDFERLTDSFKKKLVIERHAISKDRTVQDLSDKGLFGNGAVDWHNDWSYGRGSYYGTALYNVENASISPPYFCDMSHAQMSLLKKYENVSGTYFPPVNTHEICFTERQLQVIKKSQISRPFVFESNGKKILYCSFGSLQETTENISLEPIREFISANTYIHQWEPNQLLLWDNMKMIHKRDKFKGVRRLWRTQFII